MNPSARPLPRRGARAAALLLAAALATAAGCRQGDQGARTAGGGISTTGWRAGVMELTSPAFAAGEAIPLDHTCDGVDRSPALAWAGAPAEVQAYALICDDPDAPRGTWDHWVLYDLPGSATGLPGGVPANATLPGGARHGANSWGRAGWGGPCPPPGKAHHYVFRLYALSAPTGLAPRATKAELLAAIEGKVLATAELIGTYRR